MSKNLIKITVFCLAIGFLFVIKGTLVESHQPKNKEAIKSEPPPNPNRIFGLTIDETSFDNQKRIDLIVSELETIKKGAPANTQLPTVRIVIPAYENINEVKKYFDLIRRVRTKNLALIMLELMDSDPGISGSCFLPLDQYKVDPVASTGCYMNRLAGIYEYNFAAAGQTPDLLRNYIDIWEIGNEINGIWFGNREKTDNESRGIARQTVIAQIKAAYTFFEAKKAAIENDNKNPNKLIKDKAPQTAITYYFNDAVDGRHSYDNEPGRDEPEYSMVKWIKDNGENFKNVDYVLISYYPDDNFYTPDNSEEEIPLDLLSGDWNEIFKLIRDNYSKTTKFGIGEMGTHCMFEGRSCVRKNVAKLGRSEGCCPASQVNIIMEDYEKLDRDLRVLLKDENRFVGGYFYWFYSPDVINKMDNGSKKEKEQARDTRNAIIHAYGEWNKPITLNSLNSLKGPDSPSENKAVTQSPLRILQPGDKKPAPYTILIVSNPAFMEKNLLGRFKPHRDPINDQPDKFNASVDYIYANLFGNLPDQSEKFLADETIRDKIRVISIWTNDLPVKDENSLVRINGQFESRQAVINEFIKRLKKRFPDEYIIPDVVFAVTGYPNEQKGFEPTAFWSIDDMSNADKSKIGIPFTFDGKPYWHCFYSQIPGMVAIHADHDSMRALHEFSHAASSAPNGYVSDLYNDNDNDLTTLIINKKIGAEYINHIPPEFGIYNGISYLSDSYRDAGAQNTIHAERFDTRFPALMDNYNSFPTQSRHDKLTRQFLLDRIRVKVSR